MEFKVVNNTNEVVLVEVVFADAMDKMSNKGFSGKEKYIKFTKGKNHTITVYDEHANGYLNFSFGESGYTMISDDVNTLKDKVYRFLLSQHIQPQKMTPDIETDLIIMPPKNGYGIAGNHCVHLGGEFAIFLSTESEIKDLFGEYEIFDTKTAPTGVTVHNAKLKVSNAPTHQFEILIKNFPVIKQNGCEHREQYVVRHSNMDWAYDSLEDAIKLALKEVNGGVPAEDCTIERCAVTYLDGEYEGIRDVISVVIRMDKVVSKD